MARGSTNFGTRARLAALAALALSAPLLIGGTGRLTSLDQRLLAAHNRERSAAGVPALAWDPVLAAEAAAWGGELAASGEFEHATDVDGEDPQGENLWAGTRGAYAPEEMVEGWIEEKKFFRPGRFPDNSATGDFADVGHYTQLMWRESDRVGCALAEGADEEVLVCRYRTAGNVVGERPF
jgi:cysteine-rich secretory family protein